MEYNAVEKALLVLSSFEDRNQPIGTVELAERLSLNKTTVNRIMNTLKKHKFLEQNPLNKQYSLGPKIAVLGKSITQSLEGQTAMIAKPYADRLRDQVGETVHVEVLSGNHIYLAYAVRGPNPVSVAIDVGDIVYPHVHAGAKCIAAFSDPEKVDKWLQNGLIKYTIHTLSDTTKIRKRYRDFVQNGFSVDNGEYDENVFALAAPIFDDSAKVVASVVIVAPKMRKAVIERKHVIRTIKETAGLISNRLLCPKKYEEICQIQLEMMDN